MITFKLFLEKAVDQAPAYKDLSVEKAVELLNLHCKDALWMLHDNKPIYRADKRLGASTEDYFKMVDASSTERASQNTSNFYTVILDNIPSMDGFPKRSRSFIGSLDRDRADNYARHTADLFVMVPFDGVKVGFVNNRDMWDHEINLFGRKEQISDINEIWKDLFKRLKISSTKALVSYSMFEELSNLYSKKPNKVLHAIYDCFKANYIYNISVEDIAKTIGNRTMLQYLDSVYGTNNTDMKVGTTKDKNLFAKMHDIESEVWVGGKIIMISDSMWKKMREAL